MSSKGAYKPWELEWKSEHIKRYWDWWGSNSALVSLYFSWHLGDALLDDVSRYVQLSGIFLDIGSGPGFLIDKLLGRGGVEVFAVDVSAKTIDVLNKRFARRAGFLGGRVIEGRSIPMSDHTVDVVLLIEFIEHLDDELLLDILQEAWRVIKPGGYVICTTPNEEFLPESQTICPACGCVFHTYQHMRSFSTASIKGQMEETGFSTLTCYTTLLSSLPKWVRPFYRMAYRWVKPKLPHLIYIGRKNS